jgi:DNA repair exonuclease SbcCD nuclease subunit
MKRSFLRCVISDLAKGSVPVPLFKKAVIFTDFHFGRGGNNPVANQDNLDFLDWAIERAKSWGAETCIFMGDWFDNRYSIGVLSLHSSLLGMEKLNDAFGKIYWLIGNHDAPYKDKLNSSSIEIGRTFSNIEIIRKPTNIEDITLLPWLVGDEPKKIKNLKSRYVFGHLEMNGFMMNSQVILPNNPSLIQPDQFTGPEFVFSGHYHARQYKENIVYTGNVMPFNFSDANDPERGMMLLEWGKEPIMETWPGQPLYTTLSLSTLLQDEGKYLRPKMTAKVRVDMEMPYEDSQEIKEILMKTYDLRRLELLPMDEDTTEQEFEESVEFKDVDQLVIEGLLSVESTGLNNQKLVAIYETLK